MSDKLQFGMGCDALIDVTDQEERSELFEYDTIQPVAFQSQALDYDYAEDSSDFVASFSVRNPALGSAPNMKNSDNNR